MNDRMAGEPEVAGARRVAAFGLEMVEEAEDHGRTEIREGQRRGSASGALCGRTRGTT